MATSTLIPTTIASGNSAASAVTVTITLTDAVAVGQTVLVWGGFQLTTRALLSVADSKGNSYSVDSTSATTGGNSSCGVAHSVVTVALAISDTITLTFAGAASTAVKTGYAAKVPATLGVDNVGTTSNATGTNPAVWGGGAAALTTTSDDSVIFGGCQSTSGAVTNTPTGSNSELYDTAGAAVEYQITTAKTASVAISGSWGGASSGYAASNVAYTPLPLFAAGSWTTSDLASGASHSHAGPADVKGVVVMIEHDTTSSDSVSAVTYGGVAMTRIITAADTTELGRVYIYFLAEGAPDGTQNVVVTHSTSTVRIAVASMTCTAGRYIRYDNSGSSSATTTNPALNVTTSQGGIGFQVIHSGLDTMVTTMRGTFAPIVAGALGTGSHYDAGTYGAGFGYAYGPVPGSLLSGWVSGIDDFALAAAYFYETDIDVGRATETDRAPMLAKPFTSPTETDTAGSIGAAQGMLPGRAFIPAGADGIGTAAGFTTTTGSVDAPNNIDAGDILVAFLVTRNSLPTTPSLWTLIGSGVDPAVTPHVTAAYWRVATAADVGVASYTFNGTTGSFRTEVVIVKVRGGDTTQIHSSSFTGGTNISATQTSLTAARRGLYFGLWGGDLNAAQAAPGTMTTIRSSAGGATESETLAAYQQILNGDVFAPTATGGNIFGGRGRFVIADKAFAGQPTETDSAGHLAKLLLRASETDSAGQMAAQQAAPVDIGTGSSTGAGTTVAVTTTVPVPAGSTVVLAVGFNSASLTSSGADGDGNKYLGILTATQTSNRAQLLQAYLPNGLAAGSTITVTISGSVTDRRVAAMYVRGHVRPDFRDNISSGTGIGAASSGTGTAWSTGASHTLQRTGGIVIATAYGPSAASNSNTTGSSPAATELHDVAELTTQYATGLTAGGTVTGAGTWNTSTAWAAVAVVFVPVLEDEVWVACQNFWAGATSVSGPALSIPAGSHLVVAASIDASTAPLSSIAFGGLTWTRRLQSLSTFVGVELWDAYAPSDIIGGTLTPTSSNTGNTKSTTLVVLPPGRWSYDRGAAAAQASLASAWTSGATSAIKAGNFIAVASVAHAGEIVNSNTTGSSPPMEEYRDQQTTGGSHDHVTTASRIRPSTGATTATASGTWASSSAGGSVAGVGVWVAVPIAQASETDTAGAISARKTLAIGQATETDTAGEVTRTAAGVQIIAVAQASETDTALPLARRVLVAQASEADTAGAISARKTLAIGQASETDTARAITAATVRLVNRASETDSATALVARLGQARETDTAHSFPGRFPVAQASETDTARAITAAHRVTLGRATETDIATAVAVYKTLGHPIETDTAFPVHSGRVVQATETDTARAIGALLLKSLYPELVDNSANILLFGPDLAHGQELDVDTLIVGSATVGNPVISVGQLLLPGTITGAPDVRMPTLVAGHYLYPGAPASGAANVRSPQLVPGQFLNPGAPASGATSVHQPALTPGQFLLPGPPSAGTSDVRIPQLIPGQFLNPGASASGAANVRSPQLLPGQFLLPEGAFASGAVVNNPALINAQQLYPGAPFELDEPEVFEPALVLRIPPVIVENPDQTRTRSAFRTAR